MTDNEIREYISKYCRVDYELQRLFDLYQLFMFNTNQLINYCDVRFPYTIIAKKTGQPIDSYAVNALFGNIISSVTTLINNAQEFLLHDHNSRFFDKKVCLKVYTEISDALDHDKYYRICKGLRHVYQHRAGCISNTGDQYYIDLDKIKYQIALGWQLGDKAMDEVEKTVELLKECDEYLNITDVVDNYLITICGAFYDFMDGITEEMRIACGKIHGDMDEFLKNKKIAHENLEFLRNIKH